MGRRVVLQSKIAKRASPNFYRRFYYIITIGEMQELKIKKIMQKILSLIKNYGRNQKGDKKVDILIVLHYTMDEQKIKEQTYGGT